MLWKQGPNKSHFVVSLSEEKWAINLAVTFSLTRSIWQYCDGYWWHNLCGTCRLVNHTVGEFTCADKLLCEPVDLKKEKRKKSNSPRTWGRPLCSRLANKRLNRSTNANTLILENWQLQADKRFNWLYYVPEPLHVCSWLISEIQKLPSISVCAENELNPRLWCHRLSMHAISN